MTIILMYLGTGVLFAPFTYAICFAYVQRRWPGLADTRRQDKRYALTQAFFCVLFPANLVVLFLLQKSWKYGLKWK